MKKSILILFGFLGFIVNCGAQCKYSKNEYDPGLKMQIKTSEIVSLTNKQSNSSDDNILVAYTHQAGDTAWLGLSLNVLRDYKEDYKVNKGMSLLVYFANGKYLELKAYENANTVIWDKKRGGKYQIIFKGLFYYLDKTSIELLKNNPISKVKTEFLNASSVKTYVETIVNEKYGSNVLDLMKCL